MHISKVVTKSAKKTHQRYFGEAIARPGQLLSEHSENVSLLASRFGSVFDMQEFLSIAGYWHDYGKISSEFQKYIQQGAEEERGRVKHSIHGAKLLYDNTASLPLVAEIIGNIIMAHHGRLYDNITPDGVTPLKDRLSENINLPCDDSPPVIEGITLQNELKKLIENLPKGCPGESRFFYISMLVKMAFSCLVDADRLDAYLHDIGETYQPNAPDWGSMISRLEQNLASHVKVVQFSEMTKLRQTVSEACAKSGLRKPGIYKLEVPTGGGKTLSSLRFALEHAKKHNLERIIYVIPYLSILSQAAKEIRDMLGVTDETVLEHHSAYNPPDDEETNYKFHTSRWDAPIILTTQVGFLESVFSAKGGELRKLHNMARSVLIFDEAQSLPVKCVHLFNSAVNFLHRVCGSTVLLCTATQPLLDKVERPIVFTDNPSIADSGKIPERYRIKNALEPAGYTFPALAKFVLEKHNRSTLVIVNTKAAAISLYRELKQQVAPVLHLSTNMCSAHRDEVIKEVKRRIEPEVNEPVICVSTQLIEAGVNISFECVIRDLAGYDSVLQAAGRCNRHGEFNEAKDVYIVNIKDENLDKLPDIKAGAEITRRMLDDGNLDIDLYYERYFFNRRNQMDYPLRSGGTVYDLLSENNQGKAAYRSRKQEQGVKPPVLYSALRSAADEFYVIDKGHTEVVVPYGKAEELLQSIIGGNVLSMNNKIIRELGKYSVSMYEYQLKELRHRRALDENNYEGIIVLDRGFYNAELGIDMDGFHEFLNS